jgi:hypothetical protein
MGVASGFCGLPHCQQKLASLGSSVPHFVHYILILPYDNINPRFAHFFQGFENFNIVISLETKLPNLQTNFQNKQTVGFNPPQQPFFFTIACLSASILADDCPYQLLNAWERFIRSLRLATRALRLAHDHSTVQTRACGGSCL